MGSCADLAEGRSAGCAALGGPAALFLLLPEPRPALSDNAPQPHQPHPEDYSTPEHWPPSRRKEGEREKKRAAFSPSSFPPRALIYRPSTLPAHPSVQPSALHLSRGSLQSQDNLETSAGSLPETLKKFPPSLILSLYPHLSCAPHLAAPASPPPNHRDAAAGPPPPPPLLPPTQAFPSLLPFYFSAPSLSCLLSLLRL